MKQDITSLPIEVTMRAVDLAKMMVDTALDYTEHNKQRLHLAVDETLELIRKIIEKESLK